MRLLLISNSYSFGRAYLEHAFDDIQDFFRNITTVLFFPFAFHDHDHYFDLVNNRLGGLGYEFVSIHKASSPKQAIDKAQAIFVGGGNTFRLLKTLYEMDLIIPVRQRILEGIPYMGSSAGINIIAPTIKTTNDMPIVYPPSLDALDLIPFQINPHYLDHDPSCRVMMESREKRILEYQEENSLTVLGLREDCYLRIENNTAILKGNTSARLFEKGKPPTEIVPIADVSFLLS